METQARPEPPECRIVCVVVEAPRDSRDPRVAGRRTLAGRYAPDLGTPGPEFPFTRASPAG